LYLKLFVSKECPKCPAAKEAVQQVGREVEIFDIDEVDGLAEAAFYGVLCTPSLLVVDDSGHEVRGWRCEVPNVRDITSALN
jgi:thiol-disulfide isomerase/thioredoxin